MVTHKQLATWCGMNTFEEVVTCNILKKKTDYAFLAALTVLA